jgi:hypothetical protein
MIKWSICVNMRAATARMFDCRRRPTLIAGKLPRLNL